MKPVLLHAAAEAELQDAIAFYESRRTGLGLSFLSEVEHVSDLIQQDPDRWRTTRTQTNGSASSSVSSSAFYQRDDKELRCRSEGLAGHRRGSETQMPLTTEITEITERIPRKSATDV